MSSGWSGPDPVVEARNGSVFIENLSLVERLGGEEDDGEFRAFVHDPDDLPESMLSGVSGEVGAFPLELQRGQALKLLEELLRVFNK
jgi:hypothetical protein